MTPYIKLIYICAKVLEWFGNTFAAVGMCLAGGASVMRLRYFEKLQIRKEKLKRKGKSIIFRLLVSHDAGMTYQFVQEDTNLKNLVKLGKVLDAQTLRWYIISEDGTHIDIACKIHGSILDAVEGKTK